MCLPPGKHSLRPGMQPETGLSALSSSALALISQIAAKLLGFVYVVYVTRALGLAAYGTYAFVLSLISLMAVIPDFGLNTATVQALARAPVRTNELIWVNMGLRISLWSIGVAALAGVLVMLGRFDVWPITLLLALSVLWNAIGQISISVWNARQQYGEVAMLHVLCAGLPIAAGLLALHAGYGLAGLAGATALGSALYMMAAIGLQYRLWWPIRLNESAKATIHELAGTALPIGISLVCVTVYYKIDRVFIAWFLGDSFVGSYDIAYRFLDGLMIIPASITLVLFPILSRAFHVGSTSEAQDLVQTGMRWMFAFALPLVAAGSVIAPRLVETIFGVGYEQSGEVLQRLIWAAAFMFPNALLGNALVAAGGQRVVAGIVGGGVVLNILLNLALIPSYRLSGAIAATIAAEVWGFFAVSYFLGRRLGSYGYLAEIIRPALVAIVITAIVMAVQSLPLIVVVAILGAAQLGLSVLFRALSPGEVMAMMDIGFGRFRVTRAVRR